MPNLPARLLAQFRRDDRLLIHLIAVLVLAYAIIAVFVFLVPEQLLDVRVSGVIQRYHSPGMDAFMNFISWFATIPGGLITVSVSSLMFFLVKKRREAAFLWAPLLVVPIVSIVKRLFNRARPGADLVRVIREFHNESFPSGHVVFYTVFFGFLAFLIYKHRDLPNAVRRLVGWSSVFLIIAVPFSRMYLGAHWFTDVSAGALLGILLLIGLVVWYRKG